MKSSAHIQQLLAQADQRVLNCPGHKLETIAETKDARLMMCLCGYQRTFLRASLLTCIGSSRWPQMTMREWMNAAREREAFRRGFDFLLPKT